MPPLPARTAAPVAASAVSGHLDTRTAATEVASLLHDDIGTTSDLVLITGSFHHRSAFDSAADIIRKTLSPKMIIGTTAEAVLGADVELEGVAGLSVIALRMPGVTVHPWHSSPDEPMPLSDPVALRTRIGMNPDFRAAIMIGDPFTTPITRLLPAITSCGENGQRVPVIGGMASGASQPGVNVLILGDRAVNTGVVGVSLSGNIDIDFLVSQGCRPVGKPFVITKCKGNLILELGGRRAIPVLQETAQALGTEEKILLKGGLYCGTVINEYKPHFGRGDFIVRNVMGLDQRVGGIIAGEACKPGQTVQLHARDAAMASQDLQLLLDAQVMNPVQPFAALLFSCSSRGEQLFGEPSHDIHIIRKRLGEIPMGGFFAAGEFGPIGDKSYLHGHTASLAVLRARA